MKSLIITCDTEVGELAMGSDAVEVFMQGKIDSQVVGVPLINSIASKYNAIVEHFIDIYPYQRYGEKKIRDICNRILEEGHRLQLHTHPTGSFDASRPYMHQYNLDEQIRIIEWGKAKIKEWTGIEVIAHRAGGYGGNDQTLEALFQNGIGIDSSYFFKNPNCLIHYPHKNACGQYRKIMQVPVTVYECVRRYFPSTKKYSYYSKLDFRYGSSVDHILTFIRSAPDNCIITLFLHSFNFLNLPFDTVKKNYKRISVDNKLIGDFERLLSSIRDIPLTRFSSFGEVDTTVPTNEIDITITAGEFIGKPILQKIRRKFSSTIYV